jgi:hypothetical protein
MIILDSLLIGGIKFVLDKVATAVDREMNDDTALREELLAAQMRLELGEITEQEFRVIENDLLSLIREIRERNEPEPEEGEFKITGAEVTFEGDENGNSQAGPARR